MNIEQSVRNLASSAAISGDEAANLIPQDLEEAEALDPELKQAHDSALAAKALWQEHILELHTMLDGVATEIHELTELWRPAYTEADLAYQAALQNQEQKKGLIALRKAEEIKEQEISRKVKAVETEAGRYLELQRVRTELLDDMDKTYGSLYNARAKMFKTLTERSKKRLKLSLDRGTNRERFRVQLQALVKGSGARTVDIDAVSKTMTPREFVRAVLSRDAKLIEATANITTNAVDTLIGKLWAGEDVQELLALEHGAYPEDTPQILYDKGENNYAPLLELSVGQKCSALLIIALSDGDRPVIIDQPEDALDITTVWTDISGPLRKSKHRRQFIVTTHNPTVATASDSDMYIAVRSTADQADVQCLGGIDGAKAKKEVIQHLEGGKIPLNLRHRKYGDHHLSSN